MYSRLPKSKQMIITKHPCRFFHRRTVALFSPRRRYAVMKKIMKSALMKIAPLLARSYSEWSWHLYASGKIFKGQQSYEYPGSERGINCMISGGILVVLITAGIDLSVGSNTVLGACFISADAEIWNHKSDHTDGERLCDLYFHGIYQRNTADKGPTCRILSCRHSV